MKNQYPALIIDTKKIEHNTRILVTKCKEYSISVAAVSKVFCAIPEVVQAMIQGGAEMIADSRIENLEKLDKIAIPKMLLRVPMPSQADEVVAACDMSLNSELITIHALSQAAEKIHKIHDIILMIDLGDLREGVWFADAVEFVGQLRDLAGVRLRGIGTNLTCYGGVIPRPDNLGILLDIKKQIQEQYNLQIEIVSGGNSSSLHLVYTGQIPEGVNQLRLGESIVLGVETAFGERINNTYRDSFTFVAEIIELKEKPSIPIGEIGMDAFGQKPVFEDKGIRKRGILAAGRQDMNFSGLIPRDAGLSIIGGSSDHLIVDFTEGSRFYSVGDKVEFDLTYGGLLAASTSSYVTKVIL
ncbi:MAG: alanine/ornithine racemase family PLP-dependent enzyme [Ignavibacteria bacterium]|nr:alanine/ornithine racemase family PLP-dependent enzyme [Ignavibacteria bacterium]